MTTNANARRLFIVARHGESAANVARVVSSDPAHGAGLTPRGRAQARRLGAQLANLEIDIALCTRFLRTRETAELALRGRTVPLLVDPDFDEVDSGAFDGAPIRAYWAWRERHSPSARFPGGESLDEAVRRYADGLQRVLARDEAVTLVVAHEHAVRHIVEAAGSVATPSRAGTAMGNALPYLVDDNAVRRAAQCLDALAPAAARRPVGSRLRPATEQRPPRARDAEADEDGEAEHRVRCAHPAVEGHPGADDRDREPDEERAEQLRRHRQSLIGRRGSEHERGRPLEDGAGARADECAGDQKQREAR